MTQTSHLNRVLFLTGFALSLTLGLTGDQILRNVYDSSNTALRVNVVVGGGGGGGSGDVTGPASSTDNAFPRFDGTGGKTLQAGQTIEDDSGNVTVQGSLTTGAGGGPGFFDLQDGTCSVGPTGEGRVCQDATPVNGSSLLYSDNGGALKAVVLGDGTGITAGAIDATDLGTNSVGSDEIAADAVGASEIAAGAVGTSELATVAKTGTIVFIVGADNAAAVLADADDQATIYTNLLGQGITIQEVWCQSDAGTPSVNVQRDDGTPANVLSSNLSCSTTGASGTIDTNEDNVADDEELDFVMVTAGGAAKRVTVAIRYTLD